MNINDEQLARILASENYIDAQILDKALKDSQKQRISLFDYLIEGDFLNADLIGQALAEFFKLNYADLNSQKPTISQVKKIPENVAKKLRLVLFSENDKQVVIATDLPENLKIISKLKALFPKKTLNLAYSLSRDVEAVLEEAYRKTLETRFSQIIAGQTKVAPEIITEIIQDASVFKASDIHFEPQEKEVLVRFRVDGVLQDAGRIPKEYYENIVNRLKVQARLRIDEHFAAQDGSIHFTNNGKYIDARLSIIPTLDGEKMVLRLLAEYMRGFALSDLGLMPAEQAQLENAAKKPFGMILVTGPTGSGKSTTLYAVLKTLNKPEVNITTIEDPVEMKITGINQIQINQQTDLSFATGLKSIVRQDPDIILVGEIRDRETAEIAVNAALTGHLLLSTFHANNAATSIPRLIDMGIEPFLLASTLELIIAQRLARRICESCRYSSTLTKAELEKKHPGLSRFFPKTKITLYQGRGCPTCSQTGYRGRIGLFEFIALEQNLRDLILKHPSTQEIQALARKNGSRSMFEDGLEKVKSGLTTIDELLRVANTPYEK